MCKDKKIRALKVIILVKIPMKQEVNYIYFVPGLAADVSIFEYVKLPEDKYVCKTLPWKIPQKKETLKAYAQRMCQEIEHKDCILIGVSFGGVMVQEMSKIINPKMVVIVSSVKHRGELPRRMKFMQKTKMYKLLPTRIVSKIGNWEKLAVGDFAKKRAALYQKYLSVKDKVYLDWAIEKLLCWEQQEIPAKLVHIHGNKDIVFPIRNIKNSIVVNGGTHVMIINRARWFNENLPEIIEDNLH